MRPLPCTQRQALVRTAAFMLTAAMLLGQSALAHEDAYLDSQPSPHGGQVRMAGSHHFELVLPPAPTKSTTQGTPSAQTVFLYITDHGGAPVSTAKASGHIIVLSAGNKASADWVPDGANRLKTQLRYTATPTLRAVVTVTVEGEPPQQARFTPLAAHHAFQK